MTSTNNTPIQSVLKSVKDLLITVRKQNPQLKEDILCISGMCEEAIGNNTVVDFSYRLRDLYLDLDKSIDLNRDNVQRKLDEMLIGLAETSDADFTPTQKKIIGKIQEFSGNRKVSSSDIIDSLSNLSLDMAMSISAYRKDSFGDKELKNTEYSEGIDSIMLADVATAGKRIARDLQNLARQLKQTGSIEPEVLKILNQIATIDKGDVKFYESLDLLSEVTWLLYRLNDKNINKEKDYLVSLSKQFSDMSTSCANSMTLSDSSESEIIKFDEDFSSEIEQIAKFSKNAVSLEQLKNSIAEHVEAMKDKLSVHMNNQKRIIDEQKIAIKNQNSTIGHLEKYVDNIKDELIKATEESSIDSLTNIPNRKYYDDFLADKYKQYNSQNDSFLSLMLIDLDFFKNVNDTYGHTGGDNVLKQFANILKTIAEKVEGVFVSRHGGEEFAIIGYGIDKQRFLKIGRKILEIVRKKVFRVNNSQNINITISIGIAYFNNEDDKIENVFRSADKALYKAKNSGRDQLWVANKTLGSNEKTNVAA